MGRYAECQPACLPLFFRQEQRATVKALTAPSALTARDALVWVDGATLYINDSAVSGLVLSTAAGMTPKTLVSMGAYLIILPDKKYVNTASLTDYGSIESSYTFTGDVAYAPGPRGRKQPGPDRRARDCPAPGWTPDNGDYWIYTGGETHVLRQYSSLRRVDGYTVCLYQHHAGGHRERISASMTASPLPGATLQARTRAWKRSYPRSTAAISFTPSQPTPSSCKGLEPDIHAGRRDGHGQARDAGYGFRD